jgi:hypothetical protein
MMVNLKVDTTKLNLKITAQQRALADLPYAAVKEFRSLTPIRTGNARMNTELSGNNTKILALYPYASRLNNGWSHQAPNGMTKPFAIWWIDKLKKIARMK